MDKHRTYAVANMNRFPTRMSTVERKRISFNSTQPESRRKLPKYRLNIVQTISQMMERNEHPDLGAIRFSPPSGLDFSQEALEKSQKKANPQTFGINPSRFEEKTTKPVSDTTQTLKPSAPMVHLCSGINGTGTGTMKYYEHLTSVGFCRQVALDLFCWVHFLDESNFHWNAFRSIIC